MSGFLFYVKAVLLPTDNIGVDIFPYLFVITLTANYMVVEGGLK